MSVARLTSLFLEKRTKIKAVNQDDRALHALPVPCLFVNSWTFRVQGCQVEQGSPKLQASPRFARIDDL